MIQLQDSTGSPQRAPPNGVTVTLSCSDSSVGTVDPTVNIPYGQTYAIANFLTTTSPGAATITTLANGYASRQMTITTKSVTINPVSPKHLKIFVGPNPILADDNSYPQVAVELQDSSGNIASESAVVGINLISTDTNIGHIGSTLEIEPGQTYSVATFNSTYTAGSTTIVAAATDWSSDSQSISTVEFIPPKLAVYVAPSSLPADNAAYSAVIVQLQDSQGLPAKNLEEDVSVNLFSQNPTIGTVSSTVTIPSGNTQATAILTVTNAPGSIPITAQAAGYTTGQGTVTTYLIDHPTLQITETATPQTVASAGYASITAQVIANGIPISGATVSFSSNNGGTFSTTTDFGNGTYQSTFTRQIWSLHQIALLQRTLPRPDTLAAKPPSNLQFWRLLRQLQRQHKPQHLHKHQHPLLRQRPLQHPTLRNSDAPTPTITPTPTLTPTATANSTGSITWAS